MLLVLFGVGFVGNEARHGGNECAEATDIDADDQFFVIGNEAGQHECCGYVADHLTCCDGDEALFSVDDAFKEVSDKTDAAHISCEDKKSYESKEQYVVCFCKDFSVQYRNCGKYDGAETVPWKYA